MLTKARGKGDSTSLALSSGPRVVLPTTFPGGFHPGPHQTSLFPPTFLQNRILRPSGEPRSTQDISGSEVCVLAVFFGWKQRPFWGIGACLPSWRLRPILELGVGRGIPS